MLAKLIKNIVVLLIICPAVYAEVLVVATIQDNANDRESDLLIELAFEKAHPSIDLQFVARPTSVYKETISTWIAGQSEVDVYYWFSGQQFQQFAEAGYLANLTDIWKQLVEQQQFHPTVKSAVTYNDAVYAFPASNTSWGMYYNKAVFKKHNLMTPNNWAEFLKLCQTLYENDLIPIGLGSKEPWVLAAWFEYLSIRLNGVDFFLEVINGHASYNNVKMRRVFEHFKILFENRYFLPEHSELAWFEVLPAFFRGHAAMMLMGSFTNSLVPDSVAKDIGFFPFPDIEPEFSQHEIAPTDILMVSAKAKNLKNISLVLEFFTEEITAKLGAVTNRRGLPIHTDADVSGSGLIASGYQVLQNSQKTTQFFDRQSPAELVQPTLEVLVEFAKRRDVEKALTSLDKMMRDYQQSKKIAD